MRKLLAAAICLLSLSVSVTTGRKCINEAKTRTGKKCCEQLLRRIDRALSRAGDLSKPQKCDTCRGQTLFLLIFVGRGRIQYLTRWAKTALPYTSLGQTGITNAASSQIKSSRPTPCSLPGSKKKWHQKTRKSTLNKIMISAILIQCLLLNITTIYSKTDQQII